MNIEAVKVGSRQSPLARIQAENAISRIDYPAEIITMLEVADEDLTRPVHEMGGKGMFCTKLEKALLKNQIDCAIHSAKDCATIETEGTELLGVIYRGDPRDCVIGKHSLNQLPAGSRIGTSAPRRIEALKLIRPDCHVVEVRGNVNTRLNKINSGEVDALILGQSVIDRMGLDVPHHTISEEVILFHQPEYFCIPESFISSNKNPLFLKNLILSHSQTTIRSIKLSLLKSVHNASFTIPRGLLRFILEFEFLNLSS